VPNTIEAFINYNLMNDTISQ